MFGYIRVCAGALPPAERERYRGVYCGLCRRMGRRYGPLLRGLLSYDVTFLAAFLMAAGDGAAEGGDAAMTPRWCPVHPLKRRLCCGGGADGVLDFAADGAALLAYYKARDTARDSRGLKRLAAGLLALLLRPGWRKAGRLRPETAALVARCMAMQDEAEALGGDCSVDRAAEPSALLLAGLAGEMAGGGAPHTGEGRDARARFGYCLGRWVYLMDGADDYAQDVRRGRFNPFAGQGYTPAQRREALNLCRAELEAAYDLLTLRGPLAAVVDNVVRCGLGAEQARVLGPAADTDGGEGNAE